MYVIYAVTARDQPQLVRHWGCVMAALVSSWRLELYPQGSGFYVPASQSAQRQCRQSWTRDAAAWRHQGSRTRAIVLTKTGPNMWISFRKAKSTNWTLWVAGTRTLIKAPVSVCVCNIIYCVKVADAIPRTLVITRGYLTYCCFSMVSSQSALYDLWPLTSTN